MAGDARVPVFRTTLDAYRTVLGNLGTFVRIGWLPISVVLAITVVFTIVLGQKPNAAYGVSSEPVQSTTLASALWLKVNVVIPFLFACFVAQWHRHVLLGSAVEGEGTGLRNFRRNAIFFACTVCVGLAIQAPGFLYEVVLELPRESVSLTVLLVFVPMFGLFLVFARIALVFPYIALNAWVNFRWAWGVSRGNTWRIIFVLVLCGAPHSIANLVLVVLASRHLGLESFMAWRPYHELLNWPFAFLFAAIAASALSLMFKQLVAAWANDDVVPEGRT